MRKRRNEPCSLTLELAQLPVAAVLLDAAGRVSDANPAALALVGSPTTLAGVPVAHLLGHDILVGPSAATDPAGAGAQLTPEYGGPREVRVHVSLLDGTALGRALVMITPSSTPREQSSCRAPSVVQWAELSEPIRALAGPAVCTTFGMVGLEAVNLSYGRSTGDHVLTCTAERLREHAPPGSIVERTGGERFVVVSPGSAVSDGQWERLVEMLRAPVDTPLGRVAVGSSAGVASGDPRSALVLLDASERRLESALRRGSGLVEELRMIERTPTSSARVAGSLVEAVAAGGVRAHFQPVMDVLSGRVVEFEALARWEDEAETHRAAAEFIGAASDTGVLVHMGAGVLRDAVALARSVMSTIGDRNFVVSVNVSVRELLDSVYVEFVREVLCRSGVCPSALQIEIPAAIPADEVAQVSERVGELRSMGIKVALDNVGGSSSAFISLRELAVDTFKLDPALVADLDVNPRAEHLLRSLLDLGRQLGVAVVAKGVERHDQHEVLRSLGCRFGQGFLYGGALPALELPFDDLVGPDTCTAVDDELRRRTETVSRLIAAGAFDHRGLDDLVTDAAVIAGSTSAVLSVLDHDAHWLACRVGLGDLDHASVTATCALALEVDDALVVHDLRAAGIGQLGPASALADAGIGACVGVPVRLHGLSVGVLCVLWPEPTQVSDEVVGRLRWLAAEAATRIDVRDRLVVAV